SPTRTAPFRSNVSASLKSLLALASFITDVSVTPTGTNVPDYSRERVSSLLKGDRSFWKEAGMKKHVQPGSGGNQPIVLTSGLIKPDGTVIELIQPVKSGVLQLLVYRQGVITVGSQVEDEGQVFRPIELNPSLRKAMPFPTGTSGADSLETIVKAVTPEIGDLLRLDRAR